MKKPWTKKNRQSYDWHLIDNFQFLDQFITCLVFVKSDKITFCVCERTSIDNQCKTFEFVTHSIGFHQPKLSIVLWRILQRRLNFNSRNIARFLYREIFHCDNFYFFICFRKNSYQFLKDNNYAYIFVSSVLSSVKKDFTKTRKFQGIWENNTFYKLIPVHLLIWVFCNELI